jgi:hypothetical protein
MKTSENFICLWKVYIEIRVQDPTIENFSYWEVSILSKSICNHAAFIYYIWEPTLYIIFMDACALSQVASPQ